LPHATDDDAPAWPRLVAGVDAAIAKAVHSPPFADMLRAVFPRDDVRMFDPRPVRFACGCSAGRVANALRIAGRDEIEAALAERGVVEVTCEFCNRRYTFGPAEARALFARPADGRG
jgi:molecular chaperone Hsp33